MSIATKTGDDGTTALMFGRRVLKTDPRIEACGSIDELNAALGMVRATCHDEFITGPIFKIQKELVIVMGELAVTDADRERYLEKGYQPATGEMVQRLTTLVEDLERNHHITYEGWATPGETLDSAALDLARTACRRAERRVIELSTAAHVNPETIRYLNRLSDLCWLYARFVETEASKKDAG
ncbi:MAG: cob(I)alamin adenosyltransferase [Chthoniobacter sp.]|jgi:cob(I)alamin adenosyltransferase|nr:cob(I)alamin adenosyltransferase [Chthoniobacter sp.]